VLANGDYAVHSPDWNKGAIVDAGAVTLCSGFTGCTGTVSTANSLTGGQTRLNGNSYVVRSPSWDGAFANVGAVTWCSGAGSCTGTTVSAANSFVGTQANDNVGSSGTYAYDLANGYYVFNSPLWNNGVTVDAGAITYVDGSIPATGTITSTNSVLGQVAGGGAMMNAVFDNLNQRLIVSRPAENIVTLFDPAISTPTNTATNTPSATPTNTPTATFTPTPEAVVSGTVTYGNPVTGTDPRGVPGVLINAAGSPPLSDTTAADGTYSLTGFGSGSYTITPSKTGGQNGSITGFDAARIAQYVAGNTSFTSTQQTVADVSAVGGISSYDAALIGRYAAALGAPTGSSGLWIFNPVDHTHASITSDITDDYSALLIGDTSGNWGDPGPFRPAFRSAPASVIELSAPYLVTSADKEITIRVNAQGVANEGIIAYEFDLRYDASVIQPLAEAVDVKETASRGLLVVTNATEPLSRSPKTACC